MSLPFHLNNTNNTHLVSLLWSQSVIDSQRPIFYVSIIATIIHSIFWLQLVFYPSIRQKSMQWLYAYLITDILLLLRFFFVFIVHTTSSEFTSNTSWVNFVCYFEASVDNYLNTLKVYILLALNICRYTQLAHKRNVYITNGRLLISAHLIIYLTQIIITGIQIYFGWAQFTKFIGDSCDITFTNIYAQIFNTIFNFALAIVLNILVIYISIRHVHLTSRLRRSQHHSTAREKYHRSLVIQFAAFYTVWLLLWSPNVIIYQFTSGTNTIIFIGRLLNYIEITLDPIIIAALDVRFRHVWRQIWKYFKEEWFMKVNRTQKHIKPNTISGNKEISNPIRETIV